MILGCWNGHDERPLRAFIHRYDSGSKYLNQEICTITCGKPIYKDRQWNARDFEVTGTVDCLICTDVRLRSISEVSNDCYSHLFSSQRYIEKKLAIVQT
jgi:hypothetical protein